MFVSGVLKVLAVSEESVCEGEIRREEAEERDLLRGGGRGRIEESTWNTKSEIWRKRREEKRKKFTR